MDTPTFDCDAACSYFHPPGRVGRTMGVPKTSRERSQECWTNHGRAED